MPADQIQISDRPNRVESAFTGDAFDRLKDSLIETAGNAVPLTVRRLVNASGKATFALIAGHKRVRACRELQLPARNRHWRRR